MNRETIEKTAKEYAKDKYGGENAKQYAIAQIHAGRDGFIDGAQWRINSVWHDASEAPEADKPVLVLFENVIGRYVYYELKSFKPIVIKNWEKNRECIALERVLYWAYISDLLPERKEETE